MTEISPNVNQIETKFNEIIPLNWSPISTQLWPKFNQKIGIKTDFTKLVSNFDQNFTKYRSNWNQIQLNNSNKFVSNLTKISSNPNQIKTKFDNSIASNFNQIMAKIRPDSHQFHPNWIWEFNKPRISKIDQYFTKFNPNYHQNSISSLNQHPISRILTKFHSILLQFNQIKFKSSPNCNQIQPKLSPNFNQIPFNCTELVRNGPAFQLNWHKTSETLTNPTNW